MERVDVRVGVPWSVSWSGVWVGALSGLAMVVLLGLVGTALGAYAAGAGGAQLTDLRGFGLFTLAWAVLSAFVAFAVGGWSAAKVAGSATAESGALHGAIAFLLATALLLGLAALGAGFIGGWYGGLVPASGAAPLAEDAARNAALGAAVTMLLGLSGSAIGGWMASGEAMNWSTAMRPARSAGRRLP